MKPFKFELMQEAQHVSAVKTILRLPIKFVIIGRGNFEYTDGNTENIYYVTTFNEQRERSAERFEFNEYELLPFEEK